LIIQTRDEQTNKQTNKKRRVFFANGGVRSPNPTILAIWYNTSYHFLRSSFFDPINIVFFTTVHESLAEMHPLSWKPTYVPV